MKTLPYLNYQHLFYFFTIAKEGSVTKAAKKLLLSQSTLSTQLKSLEEQLEAQLFRREGRSLILTSAGQTALEYAEEIFQKGDELRAFFADDESGNRRSLRIGALSPLSKNLQFEIIKPLVMAGETFIQVQEGEMPEMIHRLKHHQIDVLLTNIPPDGPDIDLTDSHLLGEMPIYIVGRPPFKLPNKPFPKWLEGIPLFLPSIRSSARMEFDARCIRAGFTPQVQAEVDDMALLRLLAVSGAGLALVPEIGVKFDLEQEKVLRIEKIPSVKERFYAITSRRKHLPKSILEVIENGRKALEKVLS